ncbi:proteoglycan 4-like isoform X1 [Sesamum indicum]|uniref:Proteoglycan 4-like isoform X1 n=2 Tax=Sesamum indicum TaxID=4182 RepID=A0A8M8VB99_SESIN|nr:proteoglycan 4-like isoform X1 [Sesamum indicum]
MIKATVDLRPENRDPGVVMREVDEDLAIFLGMGKCEKGRIEDSDEFDGSTGGKPRPDSSSVPNETQQETVKTLSNDGSLNLEIDRRDHDWLLTEGDISLLPSEEVEGQQDSAANQSGISDGESMSLKSEVANTFKESGLDSSAAANGRPFSAGNRKPTHRAATPTRRPALPAKSKPFCASTVTSRATLSSSKPTPAQARASTPSRATSRTIPGCSKTAPRSATPTRTPLTPSTTSTVSASDHPLSGSKTGSIMLKTRGPSRGTYQLVKSRPSKPSQMLSLSHDASQNPKVSMPKRPASASRGRPKTLVATNGKPRQKSCSPAKVHAPSGTLHKLGNYIMSSRSRGYSNGGGDDVNPVLMGTQMVERVVNMRKLAPPKQDECISNDHPKKPSLGNSGFGRSLSKKSLDMAIRHMDIRRSIPDNLRPVATAILSSSVCDIQSGSSKSSTSSTDSSNSNCSNSYFLHGRRADD